MQLLYLALSPEAVSLSSPMFPLRPALGHLGCPSQLLGPPGSCPSALSPGLSAAPAV